MKLRSMQGTLASAAFGVVALAAIGGAAPARAGILFADTYRTGVWSQTGNGGNSLSLSGYYFSADLYPEIANQYDSVQLSYPGPGSPVMLAPFPADAYTPNGSYNYGSDFLPDRAALDAAFPFGTYSFDASNASGTDTTSINYQADAYALTLPYLTGTNYSDLQGYDASTAFNFQFSPYLPNPASNTALLFFNIYDASTYAIVFGDNFLPSTTMGVTLPANTLEAGHSYIYDVDFSDRVNAPASGTTYDNQLGFDVRTEGAFMTAAAAATLPEPSTLALMTIAFAGFGWTRRRSAADSRAAAGADLAAC